MKKLLIAFIGSFVVMFVIWTIMAWITYDDFVENASHYHLDLFAMLSRFGNGSFESDFLKVFRSLIDSLKKINMDNVFIRGASNAFNGTSFSGSGGVVLLSVVNSLLNPIFMIANVVVIIGYLFVILTQLIGIIVVLMVQIYEFVFDPIFIYA